MAIRYRNGAYEVVVNLGPDPVTGKRRQVSRSLRMAERKRVPDEVKDLEARLRREVCAGQYDGAKATVGELLDAWLEKIRPDRSPNTMHGYDRCVRLYLRPHIGAMRIDRLTLARLEALYRTLQTSGGVDGQPLSPMTVKHCHAIIRTALHQGEKWGWVDRNVASLADPPSTAKVEKSAPTRAEVDLLIAKAATPETALLVRLAVATGARRGEVCGLRWSDLDLDTGAAVIRRSVYEVAGKIDVKVPKSGKARTIPLGPSIVRELVAHRKVQLERAMRAGAPFTDGFVLSESLDASEPLSPDLATSRFRNLAKRCRLAVRLHDLRHAAITWALAAGASPNDVAAFAGHASTRMTLDVYGHAMPPGLRVVAAALDEGERVG